MFVGISAYAGYLLFVRANQILSTFGTILTPRNFLVAQTNEPQQEAHAVSIAWSKRHPRSYRSSYRKWYRKLDNGNNRDPALENPRV